MKPVLKINGTDYTDLLPASGIQIFRNDLDAEKSGRNLNGKMFRQRVAVKVKLQISGLRRMDHARMMQLAGDLDRTFVQVVYLDPKTGVTTKTFYGSSISSTIQIYDRVTDKTYWEGTSFNLIEQ